MVQINKEKQTLWNNEGDKMKIRNMTLRRLLRLTAREQTMGGSTIAQLHSTVIRCGGNDAWTVNLVRDGISSLSRFSVPAETEGDCEIPIPDIDLLLGVLRQHGEYVTMKHEGSKLRIRSGKKTTTLPASMEARAHLNSTATLSEWSEKSYERAKQIRKTGYYMNAPYNKVRKPFVRMVANSNALFEALRCDRINNQRLNRYTFRYDKQMGLSITVGNELKGKTQTYIETDKQTHDESFEVVLEGGLENIFKYYDGHDITLDFIDFREEGQGIRIIFRLPDSAFVLQAGLLL